MPDYNQAAEDHLRTMRVALALAVQTVPDSVWRAHVYGDMAVACLQAAIYRDEQEV